MKSPVAYGIDFGTSNSGVAVAYDDGSVEVQAVDGREVMPSLLYLNRDGNRLAGELAVNAFLTAGAARTRCRGCSLVSWQGTEPHSACRQVRLSGFCVDSRLMSQVKSALSDPVLDGTHSWGVDFELEDLVAVVIKQLKVSSDRQTGHDVRRVAIGHPVRFVGAAGANYKHAQALACRRLEEAARRAGFDEVVLVPESQATIARESVEDGFTMCTDFGGGTFDCALIHVDGEELRVLSLDGVAVGGEDFDGLLFDEFVRPAIGLDDEFALTNGETRRIPSRARSRLRSLSGLRSLLTDGELTLGLAALRGHGNDDALEIVGELLYGGQALPFYRAIESAKVQLSSSETAKIEFRRPWIDLGIEIKRTAFEDLLSTSMQHVRRCLESACTSANLAPDQVEFVTLTGGSSQIPMFKSLLRDLFPQAEAKDQDPFSAVVRGLAEYAAEEWVA